MIKTEKIDGLEVFSCLPARKTNRPPLLFVHGAFAGGWMWTETFMPFLAAAGYPCYALSLRGHGGSYGREHIDWHSINDYVDDLAVDAVRHAQAGVLHLARLLTEDGAQQALLRGELGFALGRHLADEVVAGADLGTDAEIHLTTAFRPGVRLSVPGKKSRVSLPLEFCVKDNGSGVPEDLLPNLFDPFVTTKVSGTGLGLAISKQLSEMMG